MSFDEMHVKSLPRGHNVPVVNQESNPGPSDRRVLRRECNLLTAVKGFKVDLEASRT